MERRCITSTSGLQGAAAVLVLSLHKVAEQIHGSLVMDPWSIVAFGLSASHTQAHTPTNTHMVITLQHHSPIPSGPGLLHLCETLSGALDCFVLNSIITPNVKINSSSFKSFIFVFSLMRIKGEKKCLTFTCISKQTTKQSKFKYPTSLTGRDVNQSQPYMNMYVASLIQK